MSAVPRVLRAIGPVKASFVGSLVLTAIALASNTLNRDGMLYVRTAEAYLAGGFEAARASFDWLMLPILMAWLSRLSGLGPEAAGHLMNALFMAGACALLVDCVARRQPELGWWACLAVLSVSGLNEYRHELLREYGCWFFTMLAFWLAMRRDAAPGWGNALPVQAALVAAALFRSEALVFFAALVAWQVFAAPRGERLWRALTLGLLPAFGGLMLVVAWVGGWLPGDSRLAMDLARFGLERFEAKEAALAAALVSWAKDGAGTILFFGSLALVPIELIQKLGLFVLALVWLWAVGALRFTASRFAPFAWGLAAHVPVLGVFVLDLQFLAGRYVGLSLWMLVPFLAAGLFHFTGRHPRWRLPLVVLALLLAVSNPVSTGERRAYILEAAEWLSEHVEESDDIYIDSRRVAHYASWYHVPLAPPADRAGIVAAAQSGRYRLFVLEVAGRDEPPENWLPRHGLRVLQRFDDGGAAAVLVVVPGTKQP